MADITKCTGGPCERKMDCWRYLATPNGFWQSYMEPPEDYKKCEHFIEVGRKRNAQTEKRYDLP